MRSLPWHRSVAPILCNNGLATLAESFDKQSHEALVARTVNTLFQNFRFDDFDMHHQGLAPSKCHACRKRFCNGPWWSVHARGRPIKTPCMKLHQNQCFPKVPAYPERDSLILWRPLITPVVCELFLLWRPVMTTAMCELSILWRPLVRPAL